MKFSIAFLCIAITLAALLMDSSRKRETLAAQQSQVDSLTTKTDKLQGRYLISKAHLEICEQVLPRSFHDPMKRAETNFRKMQQQRLYGEIKDPSEPTIISIPVINESRETHLQYRVYVPANRKVQLMADVYDTDGQSTKKGNVFLPSTFSYAMPPGESIIDIRIARRLIPTDGWSPLGNSVDTFSVAIRKRQPEHTTASLPADFQWQSRYIPVAILDERTTDHLRQNPLFASQQKSVLYSAQHSMKSTPADKLVIFLQQADQRGLLQRRSAK